MLAFEVMDRPHLFGKDPFIHPPNRIMWLTSYPKQASDKLSLKTFVDALKFPHVELHVSIPLKSETGAHPTS